MKGSKRSSAAKAVLFLTGTVAGAEAAAGAEAGSAGEGAAHAGADE